MASMMYNYPRYQEKNQEISLPTCMYKMKNIQKKEASSFLQDEAKANHPPEITELLQRQMKILEDLEKVKVQINHLQSKAGINEEDLMNAAILKSDKTNNQMKVPEENLDLVITAKPSQPPLSAFVLFNYLKDSGIKIISACHRHSSLKEAVPFDLMKSIGWQSSIIQPHDKLGFTFIWKEDLFGPSLHVNPRVQTAIKGDANIARFLCRKFAPHLYESLDENATLVADFLMDLATTKILNGSAEETKAAMKLLGKEIGNRTWLVNNQLTIADVVVFSALKISKKTDFLSSNLQSWYKNMSAKFF